MLRLLGESGGSTTHWVVRIEPEKESDGEASADPNAIYIECARLKDAAELGLTLEDGKRIT